MRIHTKTAAALAIISALSVTMPAEARPGRYGPGPGAYRGGGHGGYAYSRPVRVSGYGGYRSYGYGGYPAYGRYGGPAYYGSYQGRGSDAAIILGAGLLGVMLGTAISSRSRGEGERRDRGHYYDTARYDGAEYDTRPNQDIGRYDTGRDDIARSDNGGFDSPRYDDEVRNQDDDRDYVRSYERVTDSDPYRYYRNGGRPDSEAEEGPVGM